MLNPATYETITATEVGFHQVLRRCRNGGDESMDITKADMFLGMISKAWSLK